MGSNFTCHVLPSRQDKWDNKLPKTIEILQTTGRMWSIRFKISHNTSSTELSAFLLHCEHDQLWSSKKRCCRPIFCALACFRYGATSIHLLYLSFSWKISNMIFPGLCIEERMIKMYNLQCMGDNSKNI